MRNICKKLLPKLKSRNSYTCCQTVKTDWIYFG